MFALMVLDIGRCFREHRVMIEHENVPKELAGKTRIYLRDGVRMGNRPLGEYVHADSGWPTLKQAQKVAA